MFLNKRKETANCGHFLAEKEGFVCISLCEIIVRLGRALAGSARPRFEYIVQIPRKKRKETAKCGLFLAEKEGFEPSIPFWGIHDFQSCALGQLRDFSKCA